MPWRESEAESRAPVAARWERLTGLVRHGFTHFELELVVLRGRQGLAIFSRIAGPDGEPAWLRAVGPQPLGEADADAYIARQTARDPDLWVIELDVPDLVPPFEGRIVS